MSNIDDLVQNIANLDANYRVNVLRGLINSMTDGNQLQGLQELIARRRVEILQQRLDALVQRAPPEVNRLNETIEVDPIEVDPQEPTTADMPEGSPDINVDPPSPNLLDVSLEVASPEQGLQGNSSNPASDLAELAAGMNDMNWGDIVERGRNADRVREQEQLIHGETRKKKTKKKRRKSKKKKKPYEDLIMTQKKRLAKLQKMSEKLSKKMSKTKKKRRKKKVSDSY